jgi:hypothetical protein
MHRHSQHLPCLIVGLARKQAHADCQGCQHRDECRGHLAHKLEIFTLRASSRHKLGLLVICGGTRRRISSRHGDTQAGAPAPSEADHTDLPVRVFVSTPVSNSSSSVPPANTFISSLPTSQGSFSGSLVSLEDTATAPVGTAAGSASSGCGAVNASDGLRCFCLEAATATRRLEVNHPERAGAAGRAESGGGGSRA